MCGHGPRISRTFLSIFFPRNQFPESMVPRLIKERGCGCRNWAKSFIAFLLFYRSFCFPSRFFEPKWSIAFFSGIWVLQVCMYFVASFHFRPPGGGATSKGPQLRRWRRWRRCPHAAASDPRGAVGRAAGGTPRGEADLVAGAEERGLG